MASLYGELRIWPTKQEMAGVLRAVGLRFHVGPYSVRLEDPCHFSFEHYGENLCQPCISADADNAAELHPLAKRVSEALASAGIEHRFELYEDGCDDLAAYLHFGRPHIPPNADS